MVISLGGFLFAKHALCLISLKYYKHAKRARCAAAQLAYVIMNKAVLKLVKAGFPTKDMSARAYEL